jgi:HEAT repeat protein
VRARFLLSAVLAASLGGCAGQPAPDTGARVSHWVDILRGPDARLRKEAAFKLGNLGPTDPATIVPALTEALKDVDAAVRCEAILGLIKCGLIARQAVGDLLKLQQADRDARVRDYAAKAVQKLNASQ